MFGDRRQWVMNLYYAILLVFLNLFLTNTQHWDNELPNDRMKRVESAGTSGDWGLIRFMYSLSDSDSLATPN